LFIAVTVQLDNVNFKVYIPAQVVFVDGHSQYVAQNDAWDGIALLSLYSTPEKLIIGLPPFTYQS
jgi:hypothetical protein